MSDGRWLLIPLAFGLAFLALWIGLFRFFAWSGGWRELARAYPPLGLFGAGLGESFRMRSLQLRHGIRYNHCVTLTAGPSALRLSMPWPFAVGHVPIEVPWSEIRTEAGRVWWFALVTLRCARVPDVPIRLRRKLAEALARASGGQLRLPAETGPR